MALWEGASGVILKPIIKLENEKDEDELMEIITNVERSDEKYTDDVKLTLRENKSVR